MASANVELARAVFVPWEAGDFSSADWAAYDIEFTIADGPTRGTWTGKPEMAAAWSDFLRSWSGVRTVAEDYRELDAHRVLVLSRVMGRGRTSALDVGEMQTAAAHLFEIDGGEVVKLAIYGDRERGLAALGVEEAQAEG